MAKQPVTSESKAQPPAPETPTPAAPPASPAMTSRRQAEMEAGRKALAKRQAELEPPKGEQKK